jgi:hypothetical protein
MVYLVPGQGDAPGQVLKVYRRRRGTRGRRLLQTLSHWAFEGKRGNDPGDRRETERLTLSLWAREGFDTFGLLDGPAPEWIGSEPYLWLEHVPGRSLHDLLKDQAVDAQVKATLVRRLGDDHARRHARAAELKEPLLLQEHPTAKHAWVAGEEAGAEARMLTMDLEIGYKADYPLLDAVGQEQGGVIRSLWLHPGDDCFASDGWPRAYVDAYAEAGGADLLRAGASAILSGSLRWRLKRLGDRRKRAKPKSAVSEQLLDLLAKERS